MLTIHQGQTAIGICTAGSLYGVSKIFDWMRPNNTVAQKIKPEVDNIKRLLLSPLDQVAALSKQMQGIRKF